VNDPTLEQALAGFLTALLTLAVTAITVFVIPWIRAQTSAARMDQAHRASEWVVDAVEQDYGSGSGTHKKERARQELMEWAAGMGLKLTTAQADMLIEAAVKGMNDVSVSLDVQAAQPAKAARARDANGRFTKRGI
jgi:LL-H family phage holin